MLTEASHVFVPKDFPANVVKSVHVMDLLVVMEERNMYPEKPVYVPVEGDSLDHHVKKHLAVASLVSIRAFVLYQETNIVVVVPRDILAHSVK